MWFYEEGRKIEESEQRWMMERLLDEARKRISPSLKKVLLLPPDITRYHCGAGLLTNMLYHLLGKECEIDVIPALGQHVPNTPEENRKMFGDIPEERILKHDWKTSCRVIGEIDSEFVRRATDGQADWSIPVELNSAFLDPDYDLVISLGQVVPHEVLGFSNHNKNYFIGISGKEMIPPSHMLAATYGIEDNLGQIISPLRACFNMAEKKYLQKVPDVFVQITPTLSANGKVEMTGLYVGENVETYVKAARYAREKSVHIEDKPIKKIVCFMDEMEFKSTWVANKAIYRTRKAIADDGELIVIAPGVERFGEQPEVERMIRKYGYKGTPRTLKAYQEDDELRLLGHAAAHLIHGSSEDRFHITYATDKLSAEEVRGIGYEHLDLKTALEKYPLDKLQDGYNFLNGEEVFFISSPTVGLWTAKEKYVASIKKNQAMVCRMAASEPEEPLWRQLKEWNEEDLRKYGG